MTSLQELQISAAEEELFDDIHQCEEESKNLGDLPAVGVTEFKNGQSIMEEEEETFR